jgi:MFS transporter, PPP family, 3-phenylpropionic acid transporter
VGHCNPTGLPINSSPKPLSLSAAQARDQQAIGIKAVYFAYFAFIGGFTPYLSLWLAQAGWSAATVGLLVSLSSMMRIVGPGFWAMVVPRVWPAPKVMLLSACTTVLAMVLLPALQGQLIALVFVFVVLYFMTSAQGPLTESLAVAYSAGDLGAYGRLRLWGSVGFIVAVSGIGPLLDWLGIAALPWLCAGLAIVLVVATGSIKLMPVNPEAHKTSQVGVGQRLREPAVVALFGSAGLMIFAHAALYVFFSLYLEQHGYSKSMIGLFWAISVIAEIALFRWQAWIFDRFSLRALLLFSLGAAAVRFFMVGLSEAVLAWVIVIQLLHAITFALHHSVCIKALGRWFDARQQPAAQGVLTMLTYGVGSTLGGWVSGWVWQAVSPQASFYVSAGAAALGFLVVAAVRQLR